jgi:predicted O-linked N-acetylglucosamine transferase (SPINDLY family)
VVYFPDTVQAGDERRVNVRESPHAGRREAGLPEAAVVCCCFNNPFKIGPVLFDIWARVLRSDARSVLWLLADQPEIQGRLRQEAVRRGVDPERLVFAHRVPYEEHLARLSLADLFLDTLPFNAGVTASDALWAVVPVLTCAGEAFASRMAGSLLRAAGLEELITSSLEEYERRAIALSSDRQRLGQLKTRLLERRSGGRSLFDGERFCRHLESAYRQMWERTRRSEPPAAFAVEPG